MNKEEIYDHLAQVYLCKGKKVEAQKKRELNAWLMINMIITGIIFASVFYGLTAFLENKKGQLQKNIIYCLHQGLMSIDYNFKEPTSPPVKSFSFSLPALDISNYQKMQFAIRAKEEGSPGIIKIVIRNTRNELSSFYVKNVNMRWQNVEIPLTSFTAITDWSNIVDISFVLEVWNVEKEKGLILIEDISFSS